jgi:hypothetical protein
MVLLYWARGGGLARGGQGHRGARATEFKGQN